MRRRDFLFGLAAALATASASQVRPVEGQSATLTVIDEEWPDGKADPGFDFFEPLRRQVWGEAKPLLPESSRVFRLKKNKLAVFEEVFLPSIYRKG